MSRDVTLEGSQRAKGQTQTPASGKPAVPQPGGRLDSWKEIANYLKRDVRTLHRWERDEGFPVHRHLHKQRATVWAFKHEVDAWLEKRQPKATKQNAVSVAIKDRGPAARSGRRTMLAILPFANLTGNPEHEYFSDGLTEETISQLGRLPDSRLGVIARTSVMPYKGSHKSIFRISRELNADYLLEGSVRRSGRTVRITAQLIRASDASHVWAESYDRELGDILILHSKVAQGIADEIQLQLTPEEHAKLAKARRVDPEAYQAYLKGMFFLRKFTPQGFERGLKYLKEAAEHDPDDPLPWAGLALAYGMISHSDLPPGDPREAFDRVGKAALRALELDPTSGEAHLALAQRKLYYEWDWNGAEEAFQRVFAFKPGLAEAHRHHAWCLLLYGLPEEAVAELKRAQSLEPVTPIYTAELGWLLMMVGQREAAACEAQKALELSPTFPVALYVLGSLRAEQGNLEEALALHRKAAETDPNWKWALAHTFILTAQENKAREILAEVEGRPSRDAWRALSLALIHAGLGQDDETLRHLLAAYELRHSWLPWLSHAPYFTHLHTDPRFQDLMQRIGPPG